jgi:AraC-like DNA-binding protein
LDDYRSVDLSGLPKYSTKWSNIAERTPMVQGMFGQKLAQHFSLLESSSLVLRATPETQVALTRMRMPNGFPGPTPHIPPEKAFSISVHLRRPDSIKGWGTWVDGRFHRVTEWDAGGIQIFDMESEPVALRTSGFDSVHVYIPRFLLNRFSDENEQRQVRNLRSTPGTKDDVILHWARMMLPFSDGPVHLPRLVIDEMIMMFCAHLCRTYQDLSQPAELVTGGLAGWQQDRAIEVLNEHLDGDLALVDLARECGLSPGRFMRAFKKSFGVPVRRYLLYKRVDAAKSLLLHSNESLLTVALEAGFTDQPAFNRSFREIVGTSPGRWRRANAPIPKAFNLPNEK